MKRNTLMFFALAVTAFALASTIPVGPQQATGFTSAEDTTLVVRRMYEGMDLDMWGTGVSPDGRYITQNRAFESGDVFVIDFLTGERRLVPAKSNGWVDSDANSTQSKFSPDGKRIASVWLADSGYEVRVVDVDGSNERVVLPGDRIRNLWPELHDWSPDGTQLLVTNYYGKTQAEMLVVDVKDGGTHILRDSWAGGARFSPDGRYVGFSMDDGLYLIPVNGGREVKLTSGSAYDLFLGFSPSGDEILFHSDRNLTEGVWLLPIRDGRAAGDPRLVKAGLRQFQSIGISGGRLFYGIYTQHRGLYTASLDLTRGFLSGPPLRIPDDPLSIVGAGAWSSDGQMLAYPRQFQGRLELVIRSVDGEQAQEIQTEFRGGQRTWWGPNGDRLIVADRHPSDPEWQGLWQVDLRTGETSRYLNSEGARGVLTRDRRAAFYAKSSDAPGDGDFLYRHDLATGAVKQIVRLDTFQVGLNWRFIALSPDEQSLAFQSYSSKNRDWTIGVVSTGTGELHKLAKHPVQVSDPNDPNDPDVVCRMTTWSPDGQSIVYARAVTGQSDCTVYRVPFAGGEVESIERMPSNRHVSVTPDHSRIAFLHGDVRGEVWMMDNIPWSSDR